jgi:uroporphyrinogen decarboxylase
VQGNLDNQLLVAGGAAMQASADRILTALGGGPFVFNLGHGVLQTTPPDHVAALVRQVQAWRA